MGKNSTDPFFVRMFSTAAGCLKLLFKKDTPWQAKLVLGAALLYLVSPYDLVPDWLLGLGIVDDFAVVSLLVWLALRIINKETQTVEERQE